MGMRPGESGDGRNTGDIPRAIHLWMDKQTWGRPNPKHPCIKCKQPMMQSKKDHKQFGCSNCQIIMSL